MLLHSLLNDFCTSAAAEEWYMCNEGALVKLLAAIVWYAR